ncbi:MAG: hypothetical protein KJ018_15730, partial [Burkholderiales bacterium]|nr:hypothetical protein [Burkholderiales bacterium]
MVGQRAFGRGAWHGALLVAWCAGIAWVQTLEALPRPAAWPWLAALGALAAARRCACAQGAWAGRVAPAFALAGATLAG